MIFKKLKLLLPVLIVGLSFFVFSTNAHAAPISAVFVTEPESSPGKIEFDFRVDNPDADQSWGIYVQAHIGWGFPVQCDITPEFNFDHTDLEASSFGDVMHATCDVGDKGDSSVDIQIINNGIEVGPFSDTILAEKAVTYLYASPGFGEIKFKSATRLENGEFSFLLTSGPLIIPVKTNLYVQNVSPDWLGGTKYNCPPITFRTSTGGGEYEVRCDLSQLNPGAYTVHVVLEEPSASELIKSSFDDIGIEILGAKIVSVDPTSPANAINPNIFNITVARYSAGAADSYEIRVRQPGGGYLADPKYSQGFGGVGEFTFTAKDFNKLAPGTWTIELFDASGTAYNTAELVITDNIVSNSCQCVISPAVANCSLVTTEPAITQSSCQVPTEAIGTCSNPDPSQGETVVGCSCTCVGTPIDPPPVGGPTGPSGGPVYGVSSLEKFFGTLQNVIIAIAVLSGVFIIPYAFVLMASGNPEKIKQGTDWLKSIFWGYLVIFLSGTLIRFVGQEILSLGF